VLYISVEFIIGTGKINTVPIGFIAHA